jgi:SAM-dependent methyltransferase
MQRDPATLDEAYYRENGALDDDAPARYVGQLVEALGELPRASPYRTALEVGCGASPYVGAIRAAGYEYLGVDPSPWAKYWMVLEWDARVRTAGLAGVDFGELRPSLILAAHVLEHLDDAPAAIVKCADLLTPGGELWVIVPDDSDLCNPDHLFFFDQNTLTYCIEAAGLVVERFAVRRYIERERFLYVRARKPCPS